MKRAEKNLQTRRRIMDSALMEFAQRGYGGSSVNNICAAQGVSKGMIYHYFDSKDALYLSCVAECFQLLTEHLRDRVPAPECPVQKQLEDYFARRMDFFRMHPVYQPIFCEAVINPPPGLQEAIRDCRRGFDRLNAAILEGMLKPLPLRGDMARADVVEVIRQLQDFINARYRMTPMPPEEFRARDESCRRALDILLYRIVKGRNNHARTDREFPEHSGGHEALPGNCEAGCARDAGAAGQGRVQHCGYGLHQHAGQR